MGKFLSFISIAVLLSAIACTKNSSSVSPLQGIGCSVETTVVGAVASEVASLLTCSDPAQIAADLNTALGNANLCAAPISQPASLGIASAPLWKKIGDVTDDQLKKGSGPKMNAVSTMGVVGAVACPIVVNVVIGYATQAIPNKWGCSASTTAQNLTQVLVAACTAAVPI